MPLHRFVIVTGQRTGSTMLVKSLDSSAQIFCAGEIFHTGANVYHGEYRFSYSLAKKNPFARFLNAHRMKHRVQHHLRCFYEEAGAEVGVDAVGFKLMTSQTRTFPWLMRMLQELGARPVYLLRRDVLATAISYYRAKASGVFHSDKHARTSASRALSIDEVEFRRIIELCRTNRRQIEELHRNHGGLLLAYEDMVADWPGFVSVIGVEVGIGNLSIQKAISKLQPGIDATELVDEETLRERFGALASD